MRFISSRLLLSCLRLPRGIQWLKTFHVPGTPALASFHDLKAANSRASGFQLGSIFIFRPGGRPARAVCDRRSGVGIVPGGGGGSEMAARISRRSIAPDRMGAGKIAG